MDNNNLKYCREELGMTQIELGNIFNVSNSTICGWENNNDSIPLKKLVAFSNMYSYSLDYLTGLSRTSKKHKKFKPLDKRKIGMNLKRLRTSLNLTQEQFANECMISQTTLSNYELGYFLITTLNLYTICKNHKISMDKFLLESETIKEKVFA